MGERFLPARKGGEVRGLESIKLSAVASSADLKQRWWVPAPLPAPSSPYSPHLRAGVEMRLSPYLAI
jgi:hypothetical protein